MLAYGHKDIITKAEGIWEGPELFLFSYEEARSKSLHQSHPVDPEMIQPRTLKRSYWQTRRKVAVNKAKKRIADMVTGGQPPQHE